MRHQDEEKELARLKMGGKKRLEAFCPSTHMNRNNPGINPHSNLVMEFRWNTKSMLEKSKSYMPDMTKMELKAMKYLRLSEDIRILQADKGNCMVVLDESKYKDKLNTLLESGVYEPLLKYSTAKVERRVQKLISKHRTAPPTDLKHKLTPYHSKPSHLYVLPKIHKPDITLGPTVRFHGSPYYALAGFLHKITIILLKNRLLCKEFGPLCTVVEVCKPSISGYPC
jgi:hypothetical protein